MFSDENDKESDTEEMDTGDNFGDVPDHMEIKGSQDMFANSEDFFFITILQFFLFKTLRCSSFSHSKSLIFNHYS